MALTKATQVKIYEGRPPAIVTNSVEDKFLDGVAGLRKCFGAVGDGVHDDTPAFMKWWDLLMDVSYKRRAAMSGEQPYMLQKGPQLLVEDGAFVFDGASLNIATGMAFVLNIKGMSPLASKILIQGDRYFLDLDNNPVFSNVSDLTFHGGLGALRMKSKSRNATSFHTFERLRMSRYKQCALSHNSIDMPYLKVRDSSFMGDPTQETIGLCISGLSAGSEVTNNQFVDNRYGIKLAVAYNGVERNGPPTPINVTENDFYRSGDRAGASYDIWIEPGATSNNAGRGLILSKNKFGQENLKSPDAHILVADSANGSGGNLNGDRMHTEVKSVGFLSGLISEKNNINSANAGYYAPYIRTFTPNIGNMVINDIYDNGMPSRIVDYAGGIVQSDIINLGRTNLFVIENSLALEKGEVPSLLSNMDGVFRVQDKMGLLVGHPQSQEVQTGSQLHEFSHLYKGPTSGIPVVNATKVSIANSYGGPGEATEVTVGSADGRAVATITGATAGKLHWIDFDVKRSSSNPATRVLAEVLTPAGVLLMRRIILLDADNRWQKVVLPFYPNESGSFLVRFKVSGYSSTSTTFQVGNLNVYRNSCPVNTGHNGGLASGWSVQHMVMGNYHLWVSASGNLMIKSGQPTGDADGVIVGAQA